MYDLFGLSKFNPKTKQCINSMANKHPDYMHKLLRGLRRIVFFRLPFMQMASDVSDVVYLNWMVNVADVAHLVPPGVELWQHKGLTVLSILTYHHGHFGPLRLKALRKLFPSPVQTNWRLYVASYAGEKVEVPTVLFLKNGLNNLFYVWGATLMTDALAAECPAVLEFKTQADGFMIHIQPGLSNFPDLDIQLTKGCDEVSQAGFAEVFGNLETALEWLVPQQQALTWVPELKQTLALASIELPVGINAIEPLQACAGFQSTWLSGLVRQGQPFCFLLPKVAFKVLSEQLIRISSL